MDKKKNEGLSFNPVEILVFLGMCVVLVSSVHRVYIAQSHPFGFLKSFSKAPLMSGKDYTNDNKEIYKQSVIENRAPATEAKAK